MAIPTPKDFLTDTYVGRICGMPVSLEEFRVYERAGLHERQMLEEYYYRQREQMRNDPYHRLGLIQGKQANPVPPAPKTPGFLSNTILLLTE